ncbi:MAG: hypothetical protein ACYC5J_17920 [Chloroflexota bacterium]
MIRQPVNEEMALRQKATPPPRHQNHIGGPLAWVLPSLADVVFVALLGLALGPKAHQLLNSDGDLARHLAMGRQILASGTIPTIDLFSHTMAGEPFVPYEWLSEVTFALIHQWLGLGGVAVLAATLAALPFLLLLRWTVRDGANPFVALALVTAGALATSMHWLARPHLFTILLALLWTRALASHRETGSLRPLAALPPMMALWANLHGGFLVGFVVLGVFLVEAVSHQLSAISRQPSAISDPHETPALPGHRLPHGRALNGSVVAMAIAGGASLAATGLNPVGYRILPHVTGYFRSQFLVDNTLEYLSPNFHNLGPQLFLALLLVAMVSLALVRRPVPIGDLGLLLIWTGFALYSARNIPLFVVVCLPVVAGLATDALRGLRGTGTGVSRRLAATERQMGRPLLPILAIAAALLISTSAPTEAGSRIGFDPAVFPVEALARAEEVGARGNLFNLFSWGGYILYAGYPKHRVFIDGQTDFYGEQLTREYLQVAQLEPGWEDLLDRHQVDWVLFPHRSPLSQLLALTHGWRLAYEDSTADIFIRVP